MALARDGYEQMNVPDTQIGKHCFPSFNALPLDISEGDVYTALKKAAGVHGYADTLEVLPLTRMVPPCYNADMLRFWTTVDFSLQIGQDTLNREQLWREFC